jgi:hypothetical protein
MMPVEVRKWIEGASRVRMRREIELATVAANDLAIDKRHDWIAARKQEADYRHVERMADAEKRYPQAMAAAEEDWCKRLCMEFDGRYV